MTAFRPLWDDTKSMITTSDTLPGASATMENGLYVIDVMPLLYRGHFVFLNKPRMTTSGINTSAITACVNTILQILESRKPSRVVMVFDSLTPTFRHEAYPLYKAQREKMPEELAASIPMAWEFAEAMRIPAVRVDGFEADDLIGTFAAEARKASIPAYLVTPDKDIAQLVDGSTYLYRITHGGSAEIYGRAEVCDHWGISDPRQMIDLLALAGDTSDNIPGIKGVGEKTAQKLIAQYGDVENLIAHAAELKGKMAEKVAGGAEDARASRFLATIRQDVPLPLAIDETCLREIDRDAVRAFCAKYELSKVAKRLLGETMETQTSTAGLPLFGGDDGQATRTPPATDDLPDRPRSLATTPHEYRCMTTDEDLDALAAILAAAPRFAFDTETTGIEPRKDRLVGFSVATEAGRAWYVPFPEDPARRAAIVRRFAPLFADRTKLKIAHNAHFDIAVLGRHGLPVAAPCHDTLLTHFALDAAERHGLDRLAVTYLDYQPVPISSLIGEGRSADPAKMGELPPEAIADYAAEDADVTLRLYDKLRPEAEKAGLARVLETSEEPLEPVLVAMEAEGIRVDTAALKAFGDELETELLDLEKRIYESAGTAFNVNSPKQLGEILFDHLQIDAKPSKTPTGQYVTSEAVLQRLVHRHPIVQMTLDYRAAEKLKSTYADKLPTCIDPETGRIHTHFSQAMTETGRLASSDPNLQNIPVRTENGKRIRAAFIARDDDHLLLSADYSQIELRLMAALSGDETMLEAFRNGADIHTETAARVYDVMPGLVTSEMRSHCKMVNFGIIYGISAFGLSQRLNIPRREAADLIEAYFKLYPGIHAYMEKAVADAREKGYAETVLGRRRTLRDISSRNATVRQAAERNAINTPVQGSAADLIKLAMVRVHRKLEERGLKTRLVLQIHDELLLDMAIEEETEVREIVRDAMVNAYDFGVPLEVEIGTGRTWLDAH